MLTSVILNAVYNALSWLLSPLLNLADVSLEAGIGSALATAGGYIAIVDAFFPIGILLSAFIGVHLVVEGYIFGYKVIMWFVRKIPGIG